jgi:hypothetical protein
MLLGVCEWDDEFDCAIWRPKTREATGVAARESAVKPAFRPVTSPDGLKIMAVPIKTRAFLVGCPRSGTTLLQSMLYAHPDIYTFPETHFFKLMFGVSEQITVRYRPEEFSRRLRFLGYKTMLALGIVDPWRRARAWRRLRLLPNFNAAPRGKSISVRRNALAFVQFVDTATITTGRRIWIEKTPDHLFCVKQIQQYIPDALFIHIVRNGPDTVASLVDAARRYPDRWGKESPLLIELSVRRWNAALLESLQYRGDPQHYFVRYGDLISDPVKTLSGLCAFLGCEFDERMVSDHSRKAKELICETEPWKKSATGPIVDTQNTKFKEIFSSTWQDYILRHLEQGQV